MERWSLASDACGHARRRRARESEPQPRDTTDADGRVHHATPRHAQPCDAAPAPASEALEQARQRAGCRQQAPDLGASVTQALRGEREAECGKVRFGAIAREV